MSKPILTMADMKAFGNPRKTQAEKRAKRVTHKEDTELETETVRVNKSEMVNDEIDFDHAPIAKFFDRIA